jgi:hypothetical protein
MEPSAAIRSRTSSLLVRNDLPKRIVHRFCRPEMRPEIIVYGDDLVRIALGVMPTPWTTPKPLVIDLGHLV